MAAPTVKIGGSGALFIGDDKTIRLELLDAAGLPVNMTGWVLLFDVRKSDIAPDPAILALTPSIAGAYNAVRATNAQRATVQLTDTQMNLFKARTYRYSWKRMDDGSEAVLVRGDFAPEKATAP